MLAFKRCAWIVAILLFALVSSTHSSAEYQVLPIPSLTGAIVISSDLLGLSEDQLVIGRESMVEVEHDGQVLVELSDFPGRVTALAAGDLTGDGKKELAIATDNAGAVFVYATKGDRWELAYRPIYLWDPVVQVQVLTAVEGAQGALVLQTEGGNAQVVVAQGEQLLRTWRPPPGQSIAFVLAGDLTGDGKSEVVVATKVGAVYVLAYNRRDWQVIWENFPWGSVTGMVLAEVGSGQTPHLLVSTDQNMLYRWQWQDADVRLLQHEHIPRLGRVLFHQEDFGLLSSSAERGLLLHTLQPARLVPIWELGESFASNVQMFNDRMLLSYQDRYFWLQDTRIDFKLVVNGQPVRERPQLLLSELGNLLIRLDDVVSWLELERNEYLVRQKHVFPGIVVFPDRAVIASGRDGMLLPLSDTVVEEDGDLFVPLDFFTPLGWKVTIQEIDAELHFLPIWGWY